MQTYTQTVPGAQTIEFNVPGRFFTVLNSTNPVNIRLYSGGKLLDLGTINNIMAGIEIGGYDQGVNFDRVQVDATAADTITVGIGNGQSRYNRGQASVTVTNTPTVTIGTAKAPQSGAFANTAKTVTNATGQLVAANAARQYLLIQNKDMSGSIYLNFGAGAATTANGVKVPPGGFWELSEVLPTVAIQAIGDIASNANIVVVEG